MPTVWPCLEPCVRFPRGVQVGLYQLVDLDVRDVCCDHEGWLETLDVRIGPNITSFLGHYLLAADNSDEYYSWAGPAKQNLE